MRRLYLQVYLTIVASLVLVVLTAGLLWHFVAGVGPFGPQFEVAGEVIAELVPPANAPAQTQQQAINRLAERLGADLALFSRTNEPLPLPAGRYRLPVATVRAAVGCERLRGPLFRYRSRMVGGWLRGCRSVNAPGRSCSRPSLGPSRLWSLSVPARSCDGSQDGSSGCSAEWSR